MVAYDPERTDWRTFRLDRMANPKPGRNSFTPRPAPAEDLTEYVRFNMSATNPTHQVVIEIDLPADHIRDAYGTWADIDIISDNRCRLSMDTDTFEWPTYIITTSDAPCDVISPPGFQDHMAAVAARARRSAGGRATPPTTAFGPRADAGSIR